MAPAKAKSGGENMKQKSLMGWIAKSSGTQNTQTKMQPKMRRPTTPDAQEKILDTTALTSSTTSIRTSYTSASLNDTPPTSDPIDVDLLTEEESKRNSKGTKATNGKRKVVVEDSDEEAIGNEVVTDGSSPLPPSSSPSTGIRNSRGSTKKQRTALFLPGDDDEEEEDTSISFSKRLSHFRQSSSSTNFLSNVSDNEAVANTELSSVADDSDYDIPKTRSRRSSAASKSDNNFIDDDSDAAMSDVPKKKTSKSRPPLKIGKSNDSGNNLFLTAAEQRASEKKIEKKTTEDAFDFLKDAKDKDGVRPGEPGYDPRTLYIPKKAWNQFTPFEKQFWEIKQNHFDTVLFFQKGKFFELYENDARIGHQEFDLKLTERVKMCMVGVPEMSFNFWAAKFLAKGYKVGKVDQAETALGAEMRQKTKSKTKQAEKIVRRELNKVFTNGTLVDPELLTDEQAGHCIAIREANPAKNSFGICVLDSSTSEFNLCVFEDDVCRTKLETLMRQLRPKEMLFTKGNLSVPTTRLLKNVLPASCLWTSLRDCEGFVYEETIKELKTLYPDSDDAMEEGTGIPDAIRSMLNSEAAVEALGSMIWYLRQLNIDKDILSMKNFNIYDPMKRGQGLILDGQTLAHIEVLINSEGTEEGSLLKILSRCITPFGKRLFRIWLCMPLREIDAINARLDAVQDLMNHPTIEADFANVAKGLPDLERIVSRIHAKSCKIKDFLKILESFKKLNKGLKQLAETAQSFESASIPGLLRGAPDLKKNITNVEAMFIKQNDSDELLPVEGKDEEYDRVMEEIRSLESTLERELKRLSKTSGLSLTYWHSHVGTKDIYLVQTKASEENIPKNWVKSGGTKAVARWIVPDIAKPIRALKEARETRNVTVKSFLSRLYGEFDKDRDVWLRAIRVMAELDCLFSLAKSSTAIGEPACRPEFVKSDEAMVEFEELRHPALCLKAEDFIPNDVKLGGDVGRVILLTGPNMGGKSTLMRMTAVGIIMAQLGMYVPAKKARLAPIDGILTRMGAYDNMFTNSSTFKVELDECCKILRDATPQSLVILDELGRGTSTYDGMAIAGAVLHQLATYTLPLSFFATHYGSLTDDFTYHPNIRNMHMSTIVDDEKCELVFLYKLVEGSASSSFGTHVANLAGVPMEVVKRAEVVSTDFARKFKERMEGKRTSAIPLVAQADFAYLIGLASGKIQLPESKVLRREILRSLKQTIPKYFQP